MSFKVAFVGAGSIGFTRTLLTDLLSVPEFNSLEIAFTDINAKNLDMVTQLCQRDIRSNGLDIRISATLDRKEALKNAKYVFNMVRIGGLEAFSADIDIPLKYGVDQCVGDTLCAGGIMYGQRGIAFMLELCQDIRTLAAPGCILLNYSNPNAMMTWAANQYGNVHTIGLCHGVTNGIEQIAQAFKLPAKELDVICAGINHQTWYIRVMHKGVDLLPKMLETFEKDPELSRTEKVRIDVMRRFGYYSTESNGHLSEYLAWYRKRPDEISRWIDLSCWINGETGGYLRVCTEGRNWFETDFPNWLNAPPAVYDYEKRGKEHGSYIIEALETGRRYRGHFNVVNNHTISNLPEDAIVEVPAYVDGNGISVPRVGPLPLGCAAICNQSISVQRLAVEAAVRGDINLLRQAFLLDPLTGAVCNPPEVWQMVDEMLIAQQKWLPQYRHEIPAAQKRLAENPPPASGSYKGAARLHIRTVEEMAQNADKARANAAAADKANKHQSKQS